MGMIPNNSSHNVDAITGERIDRGAPVFETPFRNKAANLGASRMRMLKEETIVWLAKEAGFRVCKSATCKCDEGDSGDAKVVDGADVGAGGGAVEVGAASTGGGATSKRRTVGKAKGK